ncbi:MAG: NAD(P)-binding domain-containing protein [Bacteroidota bacterium]|nr:NAD(P)-binding domain-containing protein [Bacteroidota bacterium]MDX5404517.1 NAD(P)-binding domain-containing protein [Bacteroidota bacterium]MDX5447883.1 NAD(P)-binding domain-containing protein [Bacteroidota bacterium]
MKILANDGISASGIEALEKAGHEVQTTKVAQEQLASYINENNIDVLLVRSATKVRKDIIDACDNLKMIGRGGVGMDNIDVEYARSKGKFVFNTPAASSRSVAELVFAHLLGGVRFLHDSNRQMPLEGESRFKDLKKAYSKGTELMGKTIGIIGFGRIGQEVAKMAIGLGMNVVPYNRGDIDEFSIELDFFDGQKVTFNIPNSTMEDVLSKSDFITLHVPGGDGQPVIGEKEIAKMKDGAAIVNTARGGVVNEEELAKALEEEKLSFAALDVFTDEPTPPVKLLMMPQLSLTPHIGGSTEEAQDRIGLELAEIIISKA